MDEEEIEGLLIDINRFLDFPEYCRLIGQSTIKFVDSVEKVFEKTGKISENQFNSLKQIYENIQEKTYG